MSPPPAIGARDSDRVSNFFDDGDEYEECLADAEAGAATDSDREFVEELQAKWEQFGMRAFLSQRQEGRLRQLAGWLDND